MERQLAVSVIIPTKNRPDDLRRAVRSILRQTTGPHSLIVVDQSADEKSLCSVQTELAIARSQSKETWTLYYIHDTTISGASMARNRAMDIATGDIWLFLDDDVVLEPDFVEELLNVYRDFPNADGVSGIITNYRRPSLGARVWNGIFMRGPFHDERQPIYWRANQLQNADPIVVFRFTGASMSFRARIVRDKRFDENLLGVSEGEDIDFCTQLDPGAVLLISPRARLEHRHSSVRLRNHWLRRSVRGNTFLYWKNWNAGIVNRLCYFWLLVGYVLVAAVASTRRLSLGPYRALREGQAEARCAIPASRSI